MLDAILRLVTRGLALDPGSSRLRLVRERRGLAQASAVAIRHLPGGRRQVVEVGDRAARLAGRSPRDIHVVAPLRSGEVVDAEALEALLLHLLHDLEVTRSWPGPEVLCSVSENASPSSRQALERVLLAVGARRVHLVPAAVAIARGAGLPEGQAHLLVDLGAARTRVRGLVGSRVLARRDLDGGDALDAAIRAEVGRIHGLEIGLPTARRLKEQLVSAVPGSGSRSAEARGRGLSTQLPGRAHVAAHELLPPADRFVSRLAHEILTALDALPPEAARGIRTRGVALAGGGAGLRHIDHALRERLALPVVVVPEPSGAALRGLLAGAQRMP